MNLHIPRKLLAVKIVCDYYTLLRKQVQDKLQINNDRVMRALLQSLVDGGLLNKAGMMVVNPSSGNPARVYYPSRQGAELVAAHFGDERYLNVCCRTPNVSHLLHYTDVAETHLRLDQALEKQTDVSLLGWFGEWDEINPHAAEPQHRYRLFTLIRDKPRLVCAPDAVFALQVDGESKAFYLELDRGSSGISQICNSKTPGFNGLLTSGLHRRHFQTTSDTFAVLHLSPTVGRRDLLRKAMASKEGASLHRFAVFSDWTKEKALTEAIFYSCDSDEPRSLIQTKGADE